MRALKTLYLVGGFFSLTLLCACSGSSNSDESTNSERLTIERFKDSVAVFNNITNDDNGEIIKKSFHWDKSLGNDEWSATNMHVELYRNGTMNIEAPLTTTQNCGKVTISLRFRDESNNELGTELISEKLTSSQPTNKMYERQSVVAAQNFNQIHSCIMEWEWQTGLSCNE